MSDGRWRVFLGWRRRRSFEGGGRRRRRLVNDRRKRRSLVLSDGSSSLGDGSGRRSRGGRLRDGGRGEGGLRWLLSGRLEGGRGGGRERIFRRVHGLRLVRLLLLDLDGLWWRRRLDDWLNWGSHHLRDRQGFWMGGREGFLLDGVGRRDGREGRELEGGSERRWRWHSSFLFRLKPRFRLDRSSYDHGGNGREDGIHTGA